MRTPDQIRAALQSAIAKTELDFAERKSVIWMIYSALVSGSHVWLFGPPGEAKSLLIRYIVSHVADSRFFDLQMYRDRRAEEVFGPLKLSELKNDKYERKTEGYLYDAHYALIDEGGRSSAIIRDGMLRIANERTYRNGDKVYPGSLEAMFSGSNSLLTDEESAAFVDRFPGIVKVPRVSEEGLEDLFIRQERDPDHKAVHMPSAPVVTLDEMHVARDAANNVTMDEDFIRGDWMRAVRALHKAGIRPSTRRWLVVQNSIRALAWLMGDDKVSAKHCEWLSNFVWRTEDERRVAEKVLSDNFNPKLSEATREHDLAKAVFDSVPTDCTDGPTFRRANVSMRKHITAIKERMDSADASGRMETLLRDVEGWANEVRRRATDAVGV